MDMEFTQFMINTMRDFYPNPLNYILVFEMPWVLNAAFKIIKVSCQTVGCCLLELAVEFFPTTRESNNSRTMRHGTNKY